MGQEQAPAPALRDLNQQFGCDCAFEQLARARDTKPKVIGDRLRREQRLMDGESQEPGQGAWPELRDDRPLRVAMEALKVMETLETVARRCFHGPHGGQPVSDIWLALQSERLCPAGEAGEGGSGKTYISKGKGQPEPGQGRALDPRMLAHPVECADQGRVLGGNRRLADSGGQGIAPGERVAIGQRRGPGVETIEQIDGG